MDPSVVSRPRPLRGGRFWFAVLVVLATSVFGVGLVGSPALALTDSETRLVQRDLNGISYSAGPVDGIYGTQTESAVRAFQSDNAVTVDGVVGPVTMRALKGKVSQVQQVVATSPDGDYGAGTTAAVQSWQAAHGLTADGIAGPVTMQAMRVPRVVTVGGTASEKIERVVAAALTQTGKGLTYSWGGGDRFGPSYGVCCSPAGYDDRSRFGYDCSGFMQYAFWQGTGIDVGGYSNAQYSAGPRVPVSERRRGDMLFWGDGTTTDHVALYLGNDMMVEAASPRTSTSVHQTTVRTSGLMPYAVRMFP